MMDQKVVVMGENKNKKNRIVSTGMYDVLLFFIIFTLPHLLSGAGFNWNFKDCFYTPNLFLRTGVEFWKGFLFEMPYAIGRWIGNTGFIPMIAFMILLEVVILAVKKRQGEI